jgi:hypothetical protein
MRQFSPTSLQNLKNTIEYQQVTSTAQDLAISCRLLPVSAHLARDKPVSSALPAAWRIQPGKPKRRPVLLGQSRLPAAGTTRPVEITGKRLTNCWLISS